MNPRFHLWRQVMFAALAALLLGGGFARGAEFVAPVNLPAAIDLVQDVDNLALLQQLTETHDRLATKYAELRRKNAEYNQEYAGKKANPETAKAAMAVFQPLLEAVNEYAKENSAFKADVARLHRRPAELPIVDPRSLTTPGEYGQALRVHAALLPRLAGIEAELAKLKAWRGQTEAEFEDFDRIRAQAQDDFIHDCLMHIPAADTFKKLADLKYFTPETASTLTEGFAAMKLLVNGGDARSASDSAKQAEKIVKAERELRKVMLTDATRNLASDAARDWLKGMGKTFDIGANVLVYANERSQPGVKPDKHHERLGRLLVESMVLYFPPADLVVAADIVAEKAATRATVQPAIDALGRALSDNFRAREFLENKAARLRSDLGAADETITKFRAVHPRPEW